jgi:carboxymethylenebutenolidase
MQRSMDRAKIEEDFIAAAVPVYGTPASEELRANVKGPLILQFGGLYKRVNATWPDYEKTLRENGAEYVAYTYEGVNHGFNNDSAGRYAEN